MQDIVKKFGFRLTSQNDHLKADYEELAKGVLNLQEELSEKTEENSTLLTDYDKLLVRFKALEIVIADNACESAKNMQKYKEESEANVMKLEIRLLQEQRCRETYLASMKQQKMQQDINIFQLERVTRMIKEHNEEAYAAHCTIMSESSINPSTRSRSLSVSQEATPRSNSTLSQTTATTRIPSSSPTTKKP